MARLPKWREALIRRLKAGEHNAFGGNTPDADKANAIVWLRTGMSNDSAPDFKVVIRPSRRNFKFLYMLCRGSLGFSAADHTVVVSAIEGVDF